MSRPLARIVQQLKHEPSRTGSIIITFFGDAIMPRGGSVWLGTLLSFFQTLDIDGGVVRTAISRLAADGWFERSKAGRNSYYHLADSGKKTFTAAMGHVYNPRAPEWTGRFELLLTANSDHRSALRDALGKTGFGSPMPGVWVAPSNVPVPREAAQAIRLEVTAEGEMGRKLAAESWQLDKTAKAYRGFLRSFTPLRGHSADGFSPAEALTSRILLVHQYRRVVLKDPLLPAALLPENWPGFEARRLCSELYRALLPASELWLDQNGLNEKGALTPASPELRARFNP